jgi:TorA maturation chaperone TorD
MTLARLALAQNDSSLAMATLESLIERDPNHREAADLLEELTRAEAAAEHNRGRSLSAAAKITALQGWLDAVRLAAERRAQ